MEGGWDDFLELVDPGGAWAIMYRRILAVLDIMCPVRSFHIKNYRPDWMTKELIELIKDRDYFFNKAKKRGDPDSWNIAKFLRNIANSKIRQAKREFVLDKLELHDGDPKRFWKVIHEVMPSKKSKLNQDILLKDKNGVKVDKEEVAHFINDYFINVGNIIAPAVPVAPPPTVLITSTNPDITPPPPYPRTIQSRQRRLREMIHQISGSLQSYEARRFMT